jgi:hypothetical protein
LHGAEAEAWHHHRYSHASTRGHVDEVRWSSIKLAASKSVAEELVSSRNNGMTEEALGESVSDLGAYIRQSLAFYRSSLSASDSTSPLLLYYCFLNLSKAIIEIRNPGLKRRRGNQVHGVSRGSIGSSFQDEFITVKDEGVFQELVTSRRTSVWRPQAFKISIRDLLGCVKDIGSEYTQLYRSHPLLIEEVFPTTCTKDNRFSIRVKVPKQAFLTKASLPKFRLQLEKCGRRLKYLGVHRGSRETYGGLAAAVEYHVFETQESWTFSCEEELRFKSAKIVDGLGLQFSYYREDSGMYRECYTFLSQEALGCPIPLSYFEINFLALFWFGSLVRYDPLFLETLMDEPEWFMLEGFLRQVVPLCIDQVDWAIHDNLTILSPYV